MTDEQVLNLKAQVRGLSSRPAENLAEYGNFYGELLNLVLGFALLQSRNRSVLDGEIENLVRALFVDYIEKFLPEIAEQSARVRQVRQVQAAEADRASSQYEIARQERLVAEREQAEATAAATSAARFRKSREDEIALKAELEKIRFTENLALQERGVL